MRRLLVALGGSWVVRGLSAASFGEDASVRDPTLAPPEPAPTQSDAPPTVAPQEDAGRNSRDMFGRKTPLRLLSTVSSTARPAKKQPDGHTTVACAVLRSLRTSWVAADGERLRSSPVWGAERENACLPA
jgi:hypothetical protein